MRRVRQALHIFSKDVRRLRFEIAAVLLLIAAFGYTGASLPELAAEYGSRLLRAWRVAALALLFACWVLIARVIHAEPLAGDRQFWVTRPYAWRSLLGAKILFIAVFINLPVLIADASIVHAYGFGLDGMAPGLAFSQLFLIVFGVAPIAGLAAITSGFVPLLSVCLASWVAWVVWSIALPDVTLGGRWPVVDWVKYGYAAVALAILALAIVLWQYARRRTMYARLMAACGGAAIAAGIALIPWSAAYAIQSRWPPSNRAADGVRVEFDAARRWLSNVIQNRNGSIIVEAPVRIAGAPAGVIARVDGAEVAVGMPDGRAWPSGGEPWNNIRSRWTATAVRVILDRQVYERIKDQPVHIRGRLFITLYGGRNTTRIAFDERPVRTPGIGMCSAFRRIDGRQDSLLCASAFRRPAALVSTRFHVAGREAPHDEPKYSPVGEISYSPLPAGTSISPVRLYYQPSFVQGPASWVVIDTVEPVAHIQPQFDIPVLRLADLEQAARIDDSSK
jgi:hypothetical protein